VTTFKEALDEFCAVLTANFGAAELNPAQSEDQLKGPTQNLFVGVGLAFGLDVVPRTEARTDLGVRPDLGVAVQGLLTGHIELKAPGKGVRPRDFTSSHDREQFKKLADHPNLLYSDGNEWALYRGGHLGGSVVRAEGDVRSDGTEAYLEPSRLALEGLLQDFLRWQPLVPSNPKALAELLAPLTRLLRENVRLALGERRSALSRLADEWRDYFFPEADDAHFADAYAQTVTYALLLARIEGEADLHARAAERLDARHGLLAQVLRVVEQPAARREVEGPIELLERMIGAVDTAALARDPRSTDLWLYFYEDFLAAYDPKLRKQSGVYFTPPSVVHAQAAFVSDLLRSRFDKSLGFADDAVTVLDPAVGTGTYLLAAVQKGLERVREEFGTGAEAARATVMAANFHGFELLIGPYAVAHLRVSQAIVEAGGSLPADDAHIYLTDSLESPLAPHERETPPLFHEKLAQENERARRVKRETPILACIGNPPYFRQVIEPGEEGVERLGGWVRYGDGNEPGILEDFVRDAPAVHVKNLYNLYVYFWRWALWKVFESQPQAGIVSFITPSSYLRGPGFAGMRRHMRELLDELWILDLGGEGRGARRTKNVFETVRTPVAIAVAVRYGEPNSDEPATVHYARIDGTREGKLAALDAIGSFESITWEDCYTGWTEPFLPASAADFFSWPLLTELFPWQQPGIKAGRTWPIAPDRETLVARWNALMQAPREMRAGLFKNSPTGRKVHQSVQMLPPFDENTLPPIETAVEVSPPPTVPYAYRSFDRHYLVADPRVIDRPGPVLWRTMSARQLYLTSLLTGLLGEGPAAIATHLLPDLHHFRGSFGGKDVIPLWRDAACTAANITLGLLDFLTEAYDRSLRPEDLLAYSYAMLSAPEYVEIFEDELEVPGPHIPLTRKVGLLEEGIALGRQLIWLHTFGERFVPEGEKAGRVPKGTARSLRAISGSPDAYPSSYSYDEEKRELRIGAGVLAPVDPHVWRFSVSGLHVLSSWLDYRMKEGAGRRSSELDKIRPTTWPASFTEELLRVLWVLERTVQLAPSLNAVLAKVIEGPTFDADVLPKPTEEERRPPSY
jgi:hypothetical protein